MKIKNKKRRIGLLLGAVMFVSLSQTVTHFPVESFALEDGSEDSENPEDFFTGEKEEDGVIYYYENGEKFTGEREVDDVTYFYKNGLKFTGARKIDGIWYYYKDGVIFTGTRKIDGIYYYYRNGKKFTGYRRVDGVNYYYRNGKKYTGDHFIKDVKHYYVNGKAKDKYINVEGTVVRAPIKGYKWINVKGYRHFAENGSLVKGWKKLTKAQGEDTAHWSYFDKNNGRIYTSRWYTDKDGTRYFNANGWMVTGSNVIGNKLYNEVKKNNVSGLLKRNNTASGWYECKGKWYFLKKGEVQTSFNGVSQIRKKGTWYNIKNGVASGAVKETAILAHAAQDENEKYWNGKAGDQTKSETFFRTWYNRPWRFVLRPKDAKMREKLATAMTNAAYNEHIGYDMYQRKTLYMAAGKVGWDLSKVAKDVETDCSALVSTALVYAGLKPSDVLTSDGNLLYTSIMAGRLMDTGKFTVFTSKEYINSPDKLQRGDILILAPSGHTAVVVKSVSDLKDNK